MDRFLVVGFHVAEEMVVTPGRDDLACYETVLTETTNGLEVATLEKQVAVLDEFTVDLFGRERLEVVDDGFCARTIARRRGEARVQNL